jgi:hypothetical protein
VEQADVSQAAASATDAGLDSVERALDVLESEGARLFDAPSCDCVRTLIGRAEQLGGAVGRLLCARAEAHLTRLAARFAADKRRTEQRIDACEETRGAQPLLRELLARGDVGKARRKLRRLATELPAPRRAEPAPPAVRDLHDRQRHASEYEDSLAELVASFALARAVDVIPEHAGPYNPLRIASGLLTRMRTVSPLYLTAQLNRLEELASMMELPELPEPASKTLPRKKRRALKSGS